MLFPISVFLVITLCSQLQFAEGKQDAYTAEERLAIDKFRGLISDALYQDYMRTDDYLIRWIRDKNFDLDNANDKLRQSLKWRKDNNIDNVLEEDFSHLDKLCRYDLSGHDREYRPLLTTSLGGCDIRKMTIQGNFKELERVIYYTLELCASKVREARNTTGLDVRTGIIMGDMAGFNIRQHACIRCLQLFPSLLLTYEGNYPEYVETIIFVNVPRIAHNFVDLFLPLLSPKSRSILKLFGHNKQEWQPEILKWISSDQIPSQFGGTKIIPGSPKK